MFQFPMYWAAITPPTIKVVPVDLAKSFQVPLTRLDQVLMELEDTLPISNRTLEEKIRTLADLRREAGVAGRFLEALYFLARHEELASRVRQSSHRSRVDGTGQPPVDSANGDQQASPEIAATADTGAAAATDEESQTGSPSIGEAA